MFLAAALCTALCFWAPASSDPASSHNVTRYVSRGGHIELGPYAFDAQSVSPILTLHAHVLIAPVERYIQGGTLDEKWWNAEYFGLSENSLQAYEKQWESPFLWAYYRFVSDGGQEGLAITFDIESVPACLLESRVIVQLGEFLRPASAKDIPLKEALTAWHEYGHCVFHARMPDQPTSQSLSDDSRYPIELFADAYALTALWKMYGIDATQDLITIRNRGFLYTEDASHWTAPALPAWQTYLRTNVSASTSDSDIENTLVDWVTSYDWVAIRDASPPPNVWR